MVIRPSTAATLFCLIGIQAFAAAESKAKKPLVAVLPFAADTNKNFSAFARNVQPAFVRHLTDSNQARVIKERLLFSALVELGIKKTGRLATSQAQVLGNKLQADYVLNGVTQLVGDAYTMTTWLINVSTGEIAWSEKVAFRNRRSFRRAIQKCSQRMLAEISPRKGKSD